MANSVRRRYARSDGLTLRRSRFCPAHTVPTRPSSSTALASRWWTITRRRRLGPAYPRGDPSVGAGLGFAGAVRRLEAGSAAAGLGGVGVVDGEATAHQGVDDVDLGTFE